MAQELLMPHYLKFSDYAPSTELRIDTRLSYVDFATESADAAIRFGDGNWPDLNCILLSKATVAPVYGADYEYSENFSVMSELYQHRLIYAAPEMSDWGPKLWAKDKVQAHDNIICDSYIAAIKAATDGLGVALGIFPTLNTWVNNRQLILPFPEQLETDKGFWLVYPKTQGESFSSHSDVEVSKKIEGLYRWVKDIFDDIPELSFAADKR